MSTTSSRIAANWRPAPARRLPPRAEGPLHGPGHKGAFTTLVGRLPLGRTDHHAARGRLRSLADRWFMKRELYSAPSRSGEDVSSARRRHHVAASFPAVYPARSSPCSGSVHRMSDPCRASPPLMHLRSSPSCLSLKPDWRPGDREPCGMVGMRWSGTVGRSARRLAMRLRTQRYGVAIWIRPGAPVRAGLWIWYRRGYHCMVSSGGTAMSGLADRNRDLRHFARRRGAGQPALSACVQPVFAAPVVHRLWQRAGEVIYRKPPTRPGAPKGRTTSRGFLQCAATWYHTVLNCRPQWWRGIRDA